MSSISTLTAAAGASHRPDASNLASLLFQSLDASGKGYLQQSDLQAALSTQGATATSTGSVNSSSATSLFNALDTNGDGKITKQELTDALSKVAQQLSIGRHKHHMQTSAASTGANIATAGDSSAAAGASAASGATHSTSLVGNLLHLLTHYASVAAAGTSAAAAPAAVSVSA